MHKNNGRPKHYQLGMRCDSLRSSKTRWRTMHYRHAYFWACAFVVVKSRLYLTSLQCIIVNYLYYLYWDIGISLADLKILGNRSGYVLEVKNVAQKLLREGNYSWARNCLLKVKLCKYSYEGECRIYTASDIWKFSQNSSSLFEKIFKYHG